MQSIKTDKKQRLVHIAIMLILAVAVCLFVVPAILPQQIQIEASEGLSAEEEQRELLLGEPVFLEIMEQINQSAEGFVDTMHGLDNGQNTTIANIIKALNSALMIAGYILVFIYTISTLLQTLAEGRETSSMWIALFTKFVIAVFIIACSQTVMFTLERFGATIVDGAVGIIKGMSLPGSNEMYSQEVISAAKTIANNSFGYSLVLDILSLYIKIMKYSIMLEIVIRHALIPLAMTSIVNEGIRSPGVSFLKKYVATYVQIVLMIFTLCIAAAILKEMLLGNMSGEVAQDVATATVQSQEAIEEISEQSSHISSGLGVAYDVIAIFCGSCVLIGNGRNMANAIVGV